MMLLLVVVVEAGAEEDFLGSDLSVLNAARR